MSDQKIQPVAITKPMQLLAAWLVGLLAIDGTFLLAAARMAPGTLEATALIWAAIVNVPLFLGALFLLQTKFRPELQEDLYYSTYISQRTNQTISVSRDEQRTSVVLSRIERLESMIETSAFANTPAGTLSLLSVVDFGINEKLPDAESLSQRLLCLGVERHTWFSADEPPKHRVVAISERLPDHVRNAVLKLVEELGFVRYTLFDNHIEQAEEAVLFGSYGDEGQRLPRIAG
jgi:hypothetical protein